VGQDKQQEDGEGQEHAAAGQPQGAAAKQQDQQRRVFVDSHEGLFLQMVKAVTRVSNTPATLNPKPLSYPKRLHLHLRLYP
jgi:hypothetical protein